MKSKYEQLARTEECSISKLPIASTPSGGLFSAGSGIVIGVRLGHCTVQAVAALPTPCCVDLQKAQGNVANDINTSFFHAGMAKRALKVLEELGFDVHLQITLPSLLCMLKCFYTR